MIIECNAKNEDLPLSDGSMEWETDDNPTEI